MKKKYSAQQRDKLLREWEASGLSAPEWCKKKKIPYQTLVHWRKTIKTGRHQPSFVEIVDQPKIQQDSLEVLYGKATIRLNLNSEAALQLLLKVLRSLD